MHLVGFPINGPVTCHVTLIPIWNGQRQFMISDRRFDSHYTAIDRYAAIMMIHESPTQNHRRCSFLVWILGMLLALPNAQMTSLIDEAR